MRDRPDCICALTLYQADILSLLRHMRTVLHFYQSAEAKIAPAEVSPTDGRPAIAASASV